MYVSGSWKGYWEQDLVGREPMERLQLHFVDGRIWGTGIDIVGEFTFAGSYDDRGEIVMVKQYLGAHQVLYEGQYDGEGTIFGHWSIGPYCTGPFALTPDRAIDVEALPILIVQADPG